MSNGGIIGVVNTPTSTAASGVWTLEEQFLARAANIWPIGVPNVVSNAQVWLDAADASTITASGGDVSQWNNKGTLGNFTQGTGALQPKTGVTTLNGRNVIDFAADYMTSADTAATYKFLHDGTDYLFALVGKVSSAPSGWFGNNQGSGDFAGMYWYSSVTTNVWHGVSRGVAGTSNTLNQANSSISSNTFAIQTVLADPDNGTAANRSSIFINAGSAIKNNTQTNAVSASNPTYALQVGTLGGNYGEPLTGSIAELIIVSGADATEGNRVIIRDYLNTKWGVY